MSCCCAPAPGNQVQPAEGTEQHLDGPTEDRSCRDVLFLLIFIAFLGGMGYVSYIGLVAGNPYRLIYGIDSWGNICSQNNRAIEGSNLSGHDVRSYPFIFYFTPEFVKNIASGKYLDSDSTAVCVSSCPNETISTVLQLQALANTSNVRLCQYDVTIDQYFSGNVNGTDRCPPLPVESTSDVLFRCIPSSLKSVLNQFGEIINSVFNLIDNNFAEKSSADLQNTWEYILYLTAFSLGISVILLILLRYLARYVVWCVYILMILGTIAGIGFCWYSYYLKRTEEWLIGSIVATVVGLIILLILLVMRKRIALAIQLYEEAGKALGRMPVLLFQPFVTVIVRLGAAAGLVYIFAFILTTKNQTVNESNGHVVHGDDTKMPYLITYYVFGFLWILEFILGCETMLVSGAVVRWYFTRKKSDLSSPISKSLKTMIRYHLGSIAFGSILIAVVQLLRIIVAFVDARLRGKENPVAQALLKILACCLWCFEKFLKFLNANAYIEIAIHGYGFCKAAKTALSVVVRNVLRVAAINSVGSFILFLGKASTVAIVAVVGIELFRDKVINYVWLPIAIACIAAYIISSVFLSVYEMTIDAIFICFIEDCDMNDGSSKNPYFMSSGLMKYVEDSKNKQ